MALETDEHSLRSQYDRALALQHQLGDLLWNGPDFTQTRDKVLALLRTCRERADALGLFSSNETIEDLATGDIIYLNIDFHLASTIYKDPAGPDEIQRRLESLRQARDCYGDFLTRLEVYSLLSRDDARLFEQWQADRDSFEILRSAGRDAAARRGLKISRYQQGKVLRQKFERFGPMEASVSNGDDDMPVRSRYIAQLELHAHEAFEALDLIATERRLCAQHAVASPPPASATVKISDRRQRQKDAGVYSERVDPPLHTLLNGSSGGQLLDGRGRPQQPFVLTDARSQVRAGVFRSGHRLPTMSIDEYLEAERAQGGIIDGGGEQSGQPREIDEDDFDAADRETEKQRAWDEFKEANPKGSGNTLNRG